MAGEVRAPELDAGIAWLNTDRPLLIGGALRGQVVVLDFWTYCCINCIHILPDLKFLEEKYADEPVTFIGVHSAKFSNEASRDTIRQAILRYEIAHPVVVDDDMRIWRSYAVRSWPTVVVIDPRGYVVGQFAGEGNRQWLDDRIRETLAQARRDGTLGSGPLIIEREQRPETESGLYYPGKVLADAGTHRLYVADSNHNRIIIATLPDENGSSEVVGVVGSGAMGRDDGPPDQATFDHPQGLAVGHGTLYVADTENHLIRAVDLGTLNVRTVVGTGAMTYDWAGGGMGLKQGINSPWDLTVEGSTLYVAMAGTHQIWRMDMPVGFARALAGNGRENLVDGPTETSAFAQPSGICIAGGTIYVADSEVSAIRAIDMAGERVSTVIGQGLFYFGDEDGTFPQAKLQHPLGVAAWGSVLLVADTYNHKIKVVDPKARSVRTCYGTGQPGVVAEDGAPAFFEPGGLSVLRSVDGQDILFVADTNNHRIVRIDLATHAWSEVNLSGLTAPPVGRMTARAVGTLSGRGSESVRSSAVPAAEIADAAVAETVRLEPIEITAGRDVELTIEVTLPEGAHLNREAPWRLRVSANGTTMASGSGQSESFPLRVRIPAHAVVAGCDWKIDIDLTYCNDRDGLCTPMSKSSVVFAKGPAPQVVPITL